MNFDEYQKQASKFAFYPEVFTPSWDLLRKLGNSLVLLLRVRGAITPLRALVLMGNVARL